MEVSHEILYEELLENRRLHGELAKTVCTISSNIQEMQKDITKTKDVVEAWNTAQNVGLFLKWISGILAACTALWASWKFLLSGEQ